MLYFPPRSTFHHVCLYGAVVPILSVLIHVSVFLSTALLASYKLEDIGEGNLGDWEEKAWNDRSSVKPKICVVFIKLM